MPRPTHNDVHVDRALTNVSQQYKNGVYIAEQVAPIVPVDFKSDLYFSFDESSFFRRRAKPRAPGTRAKRVDYAVSTGSYLCLSYALAKEIPDETRNNADAPLRPEISATNFVTDGLMLDMEARVAAKTTGGSGLWAYSASPTTQWTSDTSNPYSDIQTLKRNVIQNIGMMPNVAVMSWDTWSYLENHPDFLDRVKYTRPGATATPDDLMNWFGFEKVLVGTAIVDISLEGQSASKQFVWGDGFWAGYVPMAATIETPAALYCFRWGQRMVERFREDQEKQTVIAAEEYMAETICGSVAGGILYNAV